MSPDWPPIPYGRTDFEALRRERTLYVDKTRFLHELEEVRYANAGPPDAPIDRHVRIDYGKLFDLLSVNRQLGDTFDLLRQHACEGEGTVYAAVSDGFLLEDLAEPENLPSLLHYCGLLSIRAAPEHTPLLGVPNQTVRRLLCGSRRRDG